MYVEPESKEVDRPASYLDRKRGTLLQHREGLLQSLSEAARQKRNKRVRHASLELCRTNESLDMLDRIDKEQRSERKAAENGSGRRFVVSSLFLQECFEKLTADEREQFFFITGSEADSVLVLDQRVELRHESRTVTGVVAEQRSTHKLLIKLEKFGHRLLGHFHSHPGDGPGSTRPSGIDEKFQQRLESAGHLAVAAIFSRDGYVRFFRLDNDFELEIHGTGVERHDDNIYRLTTVAESSGSTGSRRIGPARKHPRLRAGRVLDI